MYPCPPNGCVCWNQTGTFQPTTQPTASTQPSAEPTAYAHKTHTHTAQHAHTLSVCLSLSPSFTLSRAHSPIHVPVYTLTRRARTHTRSKTRRYVTSMVLVGVGYCKGTTSTTAINQYVGTSSVATCQQKCESLSLCIGRRHIY